MYEPDNSLLLHQTQLGPAQAQDILPPEAKSKMESLSVPQTQADWTGSWTRISTLVMRLTVPQASLGVPGHIQVCTPTEGNGQEELLWVVDVTAPSI